MNPRRHDRGHAAYRDGLLLSIGMVALGWMESSSAPWATEGRQEKDAAEKIVLDLGGGVKMEFVRIKAGKFMMGSKNGDADEKPVHEVTITKDYWLQTTETTQGQWGAVMGKNPSRFKGADLPVETVSWEDCQEFMKKLNEKLALRSSSEGGAKDQLKGKAAKLPTEAEWEYSCRAGEKGKWCFGDDEKKLGDYAWYGKNSDMKTHPVGQKKANAWGLYDMHGNVWEWCEDWYEEKYPSEAVTDSTGPAKGKYRCMRGGSWLPAGSTRSAYRDRYQPSDRNRGNGLRAALHGQDEKSAKKEKGQPERVSLKVDGENIHDVIRKIARPAKIRYVMAYRPDQGPVSPDLVDLDVVDADPRELLMSVLAAGGLSFSWSRSGVLVIKRR